MSKRKQIETFSRCPNGTRRNKKTGICEARTAKRPASTTASSKSKIKLGKSSRCPNGSRKNKKTGLCETIARARTASTNAPIIRQSSIRNSPFRFPYNSAEISPVNRRRPLYASASSPSPGAPHIQSKLKQSRLVDLSPSSPFAQKQNIPSLASRNLIQFSPDSKNLIQFSPNPKNLIELSPISPSAQKQNNPSLTRRDLIQFSPTPKNFIEFSPDLPSLKKVTPKQMRLPSKGNMFPFSKYPLAKSARMQGIKMSHKYKKTEKDPLGKLKRFPTNPYYDFRIAQLWKSPASSASSSSFRSLENSPSEVFLTPESDVYLSPERSPIILRKSGLSNKLKRKKSDKSSPSYSLPANKDKYSSKRKNTRSMSRSARSFLPENEQRTLQKMSARHPSKPLETSMKSRSPSKSPSPKRVTPASPFYELYPKYSPRKVKSRKSYNSALLAEIIANKKQMKEFTRKLKYKKEIKNVRRIVANSTRKKSPVQSQGWASYLWSKVPKLRDK
jgi:hypothetical protein